MGFQSDTVWPSDPIYGDVEFNGLHEFHDQQVWNPDGFEITVLGTLVFRLASQRFLSSPISVGAS